MSETRTLKALSVRQPWAWALIYGAKRIENRSRRTYHRGPLVIHAGRSTEELLGRPHEEWRSIMPDIPSRLPEAAHLGVLYGLVEVVDCVPLSEVAGRPFAEGPWCWITANPRPIEPTRFRGQQGLFDVPADRIVVRPRPRGESIVGVHEPGATSGSEGAEIRPGPGPQ